MTATSVRAGAGTDVRVRSHRTVTRDGTALALDAYLPHPTRPCPVVVTRTPYSRAQHLDEGLGWARSGVAFVAQDVRGRYGSDGTWRPYEDERADGADLLAWLHDQPWCDGRVVATGASYAAGTAWALAVEAAHAGLPVHGVLSMVPALGLGRVKFDPSGVLRLAEHVTWWVEHGDARVSRTGLAQRLLQLQPDLLTHLPVLDLGDRLQPALPGWADVVRRGPAGHPDVADEHELAHLDVDSLHVGGWQDLLVGETLRQYALVGSAAAAPGRRTLVVGPWGHDLGGTSAAVGDQPLGRLVQEWVRGVLGHAGSARPQAAVHLGDALTGRWWHGRQWPPVTATGRRHLAAGGRLRSVPGPAGTATFTYDSAHPTPGAPLLRPASCEPRPDVLRHRTGPLADDLVLRGVPVVHLRADADRPADWVVRLSSTAPDGRRTPLAQAVLADHAHVDARLPLSAVVARVPAGHGLEVEVAGSDVPALARPLGSPADRHTGARHVRTTQHVRTGTGGSHLELPVAPAVPGEPT